MNNINIPINSKLQVVESSSVRAKDVAYATGAREETAQPYLIQQTGQEEWLVQDWQADEKLKKALETLQIEYGVKVEMASDDNGKIFIRIMSEDGERVIRQMPPDSLIKLQANLKHNRGMLADWLA